MSADVDAALVSIAAEGLPGSLHEPPRDQLGERDAQELLSAVAEQRMTAVALASARAGKLALPQTAMSRLVDLHRQEMTRCLEAEHALLTAVGILKEAGIDSRVLGDSAIALLDYHAPAMRTFDGLELLVRTCQIQDAVTALGRAGWRIDPSGHGRRRTMLGPANVPLRLQTSLEGVPGGVVVDETQLWSDSQPLRIGDSTCRALGREIRLLEASFRAALDSDEPSPLMAQRDVVEIVLFGRWSRPQLMELAAAWRAHQILARAVRHTWRRLAIADVTALSVWADNHTMESRRPIERRVRTGGGSGVPWRGIRSALARRA